MFEEHGASPEISTNRAFLPSAVLSRPPPVPPSLQRRQKSTGLVRIAVALGVVAATVFLVLTCFRLARKGISRAFYRRRLAGASGENGGGAGDSNCSDSIMTDGTEGEENTETSQGGASNASDNPSPSEGEEEPMEVDSPPEEEGKQEPKDPQPPSEPGPSPMPGGSGEAPQPPPPSPPRKRKQKTKHLNSPPPSPPPSGIPDPWAPLPDPPPLPPQAPPSSDAGPPGAPAAGSPYTFLGPETSPFMRLSLLNVLGRLVGQAATNAQTGIDKDGADKKGYIFLLRMLYTQLRKDTDYARDFILPTNPNKPNFKKSVDFGTRMCRRAEELLSSEEIASASSREEGTEEQGPHPLTSGILRVANTSAQLRFLGKSCMEKDTQERWEQLRLMLSSCQNLRTEMQALLDTSEGAHLRAAVEMLREELAIFSVGLTAAGALLKAKELEDEESSDSDGEEMLSQALSASAAEEQKRRADLQKGSSVTGLVDSMYHVGQSINSLIEGSSGPLSAAQQNLLQGHVNHALELLSGSKSIVSSGVLTPSEEAQVVSSLIFLQEAVDKALNFQ